MTVTRPGDDKSVPVREDGAADGGEVASSGALGIATADHLPCGDLAAPRTTNAPAYGALDLGTNNCRLLVARPSRRGFLVTDAFSRIIRLGEGLGASRCLSDAAMHRTMDALRVCSGKLAKARVVRSRLVATEACRVASNGTAFLDRVRRELGLRIEILTRETEAKLAVSGCAALLDPHADLALVFDIGGGSSELIWLDLSRRRHAWRHSLAERIEAQNCIAAWTSLPVGVVSLAERYGGKHVTEENFEAMVAQVLHMLEPFEREYRFRSAMGRMRTHLLGTSGTVTTVAGIHMKLPRYDRSRVDGYWMQTRRRARRGAQPARAKLRGARGRALHRT